jgi:hypothetical protein
VSAEVGNLVGDERLASFLTGLRREDFHKFAVLPSPLHDSFKMEAPGTTANLLDHYTAAGVASNDGMELNSSEDRSV